jgi:hypothetical protein
MQQLNVSIRDDQKEVMRLLKELKVISSVSDFTRDAIDHELTGRIQNYAFYASLSNNQGVDLTKDAIRLWIQFLHHLLDDKQNKESTQEIIGDVIDNEKGG